MSRIAQLVLVTLVALALGFFLGRGNFSRPSPEPSPSDVPVGLNWDLRELTEEERKNRCLESLGAVTVPLLPAPEIDPKIPRPFVTNFEGEVLIRWKPVPKAKNYIISIEDTSGKLVKSFRTSTNFMYLKGIPRAPKSDVHYHLRMATQNLNELVGLPGRKYDLIAKRPLDLTAPKIEEIKIED